jgi:flagellar biogenesis protein FliO
MEVIQPLAAIVFVMALLGGALLLLKKRGGATFRMPGISGSAPKRLEVMERVSLGPQHALHLVRVDGKTMVVTTAPGGCQIMEHGFAGDARP